MPLGGKKNRGSKPKTPLIAVPEDEGFMAQSIKPVSGGATGLNVRGVEITTTGIRANDAEGHNIQINEADIVDVEPGKTHELGRGAAGMVELKRLRTNGELELVAVKHMNVSEKRDRDQALKEIEVIWKLQHPNITKYWGGYFCASDQTVCFVLEYMNSGSLQVCPPARKPT
eukprot:SAG11_NODE_527_length_8731_cov_3.883457_2_plen_172_part_00